MKKIKEPSGWEEFIGVSLVILNILLLLTSSKPIIPNMEVNNFYQLYSCLVYIIGEFIFYIIGMFLIADYKKKEKRYKKYISKSKK